MTVSTGIAEGLRARGPLTVAAFMELALYDPVIGYYARAVRRSGRAGDFFTSVDVGPAFGDLLEVQVAQMADVLADGESGSSRPRPFDLVEAGAGSGQLAADILESAARRHPPLYERTRLHLVEASATARSAQAETLGRHYGRLRSSSPQLPERFEGVLYANELMDAMPVHQVVMREDGLRELYVTLAADGGRLVLQEGPPSTPQLAGYLARVDATLKPGWKSEINLNAVEWIANAARRLTRGFMILIDYGHEAADLYSPSHAGGTLTTFSRHVSAGAESNPAAPPWLERPGEQDMTAHVDFTSVRQAAVDAGLSVLGFLDQTYFVMGLLTARQMTEASSPVDQMKDRLAVKTLLLPGGLGSTMKVLLLGKDVGTPDLYGCAAGQRVT